MELKFGRHKGKSVEEAYKLDPDWVLWLEKNTEATGKYAAQNKALLAEINRVKSLSATSAAPTGNISTEQVLRNILAAVLEILVVLRKGKTITNPNEPLDEIPF